MVSSTTDRPTLTHTQRHTKTSHGGASPQNGEIEASPNFAYAHGVLGTAHAIGGRPDDAIPCIDRGVRLSPRDMFGEESQLYYAFAHFQAARYAEAAAAARYALQKRPRHPVAYIMAAAARALGGERQRT
jgi:adenylate cyclase